MKIRADFVTNSSSVSYILTMNKHIIDVYRQFYEHDPKLMKIIEIFEKDLLDNGTRVCLEGEVIYTKKIKFRTDDEDWIDDKILDESGEKVDFSKVSDSMIWKYIYGEYVLKGKMGEFNGLGATQVGTH